MAPIVTLTMNPAIDAATRVERVVADRKLRCERPRRDPGGGGLNVSRVVSRLGGETLAVFLAGGPTGEVLRRLVERERIPARPVETAGWTRENLAVTETSTGRQFRFGMPGPEVGEGEWRRCLETVAAIEPAPRFLVLSGSLSPGVPDDLYARAARSARERGIAVVADTSGEPLRRVAEAGVYLLKPNLRELGQLCSPEPVHEIGIDRAARRVVERGWAEVVVVTMGSAGALLATAELCRRIESPTVPIESRIGAGDSTTAGIVTALARGDELLDAVRYGVAAGAAAVMTPGTELCRREDVEELFRQMAS